MYSNNDKFFGSFGLFLIIAGMMIIVISIFLSWYKITHVISLGYPVKNP